MKKTEVVVEPLVPYVPTQTIIPEFTIRAILLGLVLGLLFNAANAYLGLKIGLTVSASIPSAVMSMFFLRIFLPKILRRARPGTILENNIVHCFASTGESMAAAIIFMMPAVHFLGQSFTNPEVFILGTAGGIMGIMMMIPLRHALCVKEHNNLPFPEGTACALVLEAGDKGGVSAKPVFQGMGVGAVFKFLMSGFHLWKDNIFWSFEKLYKAGIGYELSPLLVGVGYLVGPRVAGILLAGGLLAFLVIIPIIAYIGGSNIIAPGTIPLSEMSTMQIRANYVKYIGAGTVAFGGLFSIVKSLPDIIGSIRYSFKMMFAKGGVATQSPSQTSGATTVETETKNIAIGGAILGFLATAFGGDLDWSNTGQILTHIVSWGVMGALGGGLVFYLTAKLTSVFSQKFSRIERDMPLFLVAGLTLLMAVILWITPSFHLSLPEIVLVLLFSFFFEVVSARIVGLIGTTNQPVSGMTITALLFLAVLFIAMGHSPETVKTAIIMGGAAVCIAICMSGDLAQDSKTASLIGGTPWKVQTAQSLAVLLAAVRSGFVLLLLYWAYGFGDPTAAHPYPLEAPQAQLMAKLVEGAVDGNLPWALLFIGAAIGAACQLCSISALLIGLGLYIPITTWPMIFLGGLLSIFTQRKAKTGEEAKAIHHQGSLYASGLIAGDAITGILIAALTVGGLDAVLTLRNPSQGFGTGMENFIASALYVLVVVFLYRACMKTR